MNIAHKLKHEIEAVLLLTLYFGSWIGSLVLLKYMILAEYDIAYDGLSVALLGALVLAKVVLILEYVPLGTWVKNQPCLDRYPVAYSLICFRRVSCPAARKSFRGTA